MIFFLNIIITSESPKTLTEYFSAADIMYNGDKIHNTWLYQTISTLYFFLTEWNNLNSGASIHLFIIKFNRLLNDHKHYDSNLPWQWQVSFFLHSEKNNLFTY